jgi:hypothetical protein
MYKILKSYARIMILSCDQMRTIRLAHNSTQLSVSKYNIPAVDRTALNIIKEAI